ncbi:hypothetical protein ACFLWY_00120 [Chloroflexota bacterium]
MKWQELQIRALDLDSIAEKLMRYGKIQRMFYLSYVIPAIE